MVMFVFIFAIFAALMSAPTAEAAAPNYSEIFSGKYVGKWESVQYGCGRVELEVTFNSAPTVVVTVENPNLGNSTQTVKGEVSRGDNGTPVLKFTRYSGRVAITYWLSPQGGGLAGVASGLSTSNVFLVREGNPAPSCEK